MLAKILPRLSDLRPETARPLPRRMRRGIAEAGLKGPSARRAAKALGLDVPLRFEQLADEVIE